MLMLCFFYCIPFAKFVYFALGPFFAIFGLFALKRGMRTQRKGLRQMAFFLMFAALLKICMFDIRALAEPIKNQLCDIASRVPTLDCSLPTISSREVGLMSFFGLVLMVGGSFLLFHYYRLYLPDRKLKEVTPEEIHLRFWVNVALWCVLLMAIWTIAPWVASLTNAKLPLMFRVVTWQSIAIVNVGLILLNFWKVESCVWQNKLDDKAKVKARRQHLQNTWTSRDTLWMTVFLYLLTLSLSYVAWDVLKPKDLNAPVQESFSIRSMLPHVDTRNPHIKE